MNRTLIKLFLSGVLIFSKSYSTAPPIISHPDYRNFYGVCWRGSPHENLAYAKQMGYNYVFYQYGMEKDPLSNGLYFYLETPEYFTYNRKLDFQNKNAFNPKQIAFFERNFALKNTGQPFPYNLATGWFFDPHTFTPLLDFQQQKVITWAIDSILNVVKLIESRNPKFHFGGFGWDEPRPAGDFWDGRKKATMKSWTGDDSGVKYPGVVHDYSTYTDGHMEFYKQLYKRTRHEYADAKFFNEPYDIYRDWIQLIKDRPDAKEITPDIISQEGPGTQFVDDIRIYASKLIKKENAYCTTPDVFQDKDNRLIAAKAAINGSWFGWFGRFGGTGDMPNFQSITEVPPRLKLIRVLANWENINGTPLSNRSWDGSTYKSNTAFASSDVISILQPRTRKLFVVFLTMNGKIVLPDKKRAVTISRTDSLFIESENGAKDLYLNNNIIELKDAKCLDKGYIIKYN